MPVPTLAPPPPRRKASFMRACGTTDQDANGRREHTQESNRKPRTRCQAHRPVSTSHDFHVHVLEVALQHANVRVDGQRMATHLAILAWRPARAFPDNQMKVTASGGVKC